MKILVACEESQAVAKAFRAKGHDAFSCDIMPCSGGHPEWHIHKDVAEALKFGWEMILAFPPCTHIAVSGAAHFKAKIADGRQQQGIDFFNQFTDLNCDKVVIENPVSIMSRLYRKPDQIIQPWQFGHDASKKTCLWLKGVPKLEHTEIFEPNGWSIVKYAHDMEPCEDCGEPFCRKHLQHYYDCPCIGPHEDEECIHKRVDGYEFATREALTKPLWSNQTPSGQNKLGPSPDRARLRSTTYSGIAEAMAEQWG